MMTFLEFLNERNKPINNYGIGTGHSPGSAFGVVNPAKPAKHVSVGFNLNIINRRQFKHINCMRLFTPSQLDVFFVLVFDKKKSS